MGVIGSILWFIFGGFLMGLGWWLAGLLAAVIALAPIGKTVVDKGVAPRAALG